MFSKYPVNLTEVEARRLFFERVREIQKLTAALIDATEVDLGKYDASGYGVLSEDFEPIRQKVVAFSSGIPRLFEELLILAQKLEPDKKFDF